MGGIEIEIHCIICTAMSESWSSDMTIGHSGERAFIE